MRISKLYIFLVHFIQKSALSQENETEDDSHRDDRYCRRKRKYKPHQQGLWSDSFPKTNGLDIAMCEGNITVEIDGQICVKGRVNYRQIARAVGYPIYAPASDTISVTGHLVAGSGNVVLGANAAYLYDFVTSYEVDGTTYDATDGSITDNLLAASRGTIDGVCFDESFSTTESWYETKHISWGTNVVVASELSAANLIFVGRTTTTAEFHTSVDEPGLFMETLSTIRMWLFDITAGFPTPSFVFSLVPVFPFTGLLRQNIVGRGVFSTNRYPQPLTAPNAYVEDIQIDAPWDNLLAVLEDGVFATMPVYMGSVIKKISASDSSNGCWKSDTAAIDLQMPVRMATELDSWAVDTLYPALDALGAVTLHFGKRLPSGSALLGAALETYASCGVTTDITPDDCYHPACTRSTTIVTSFQYPELYFSGGGSSDDRVDEYVDENDTD